VLKRANGQARVEFADGVSLPAPEGAAGEDGQRVVYGTRPEHMTLAAGSEGVPSEVVVVEPTGADTQVFTKLAGVEVTSVFRDRHAFRPGETIRLAPDPARAHLFDAASGTRLAA
jgi:multiple sugar transport system ATP-binding protein